MKRLNEIIAIFKPKPKAKVDMRTQYELAAIAQGWRLLSSSFSSSEYAKLPGSKRLLIENGDRMMLSVDGVTWKTMGHTARKRFLLQAQEAS